MIIEKTHILIIAFIVYLFAMIWVLYRVRKATKEHIKAMEKRHEGMKEQEVK